MTKEIKTVTVIGAGTMGSGIAAHLTNAGVRVHLLDIVPKDAKDRNMLAKGAVARMLKAEPATDPMNAGFMDKENARLITPGNTDDHLESAVAASDWVIEVVKEDLAIKQDLYARIEQCRKPDTIISSNTSTIPLEQLVSKSGESFRKHFLISHFFNPPRFMRLLELVRGADTDSRIFNTIRDFCDIRLGKNVIEANDTPGFIANRIGTYFLSRAIHATQDYNLGIEEVDAVLSRPMGMPKTGVFGLLDVVGIGLVPLITQSLKSNLPESDAFVREYREPTLLNRMLAEGRWGRNSGKGGFYRMNKLDNGARVKEAVDLTTGEYRTATTPKPASAAAGRNGPRAVFETDDQPGKLAWDVMRDTLIYAASLIPSISDDIQAIDAAMREGYDWKWGPFELMDKIGVEWFAERCEAEGIVLPLALAIMLDNGLTRFYTEENGQSCRAMFDFDMFDAAYQPITPAKGVLKLADIKRTGRPVLSNRSANVWDIGDGVLCLEFRSKMNTIDPLILKMINDTIATVNNSNGKYKALVIHNEEKNFSLGANLGLAEVFLRVADHKVAKTLGLSGLIRGGLRSFIGELVYQGQAALKALREAPFPVVGAPTGMALGGGCEILLHCDAIQAGGESYIGLVESGVGLIPGWGGNVRYLERALAMQGQMKGPMAAVKDATMAIMMPQFSISSSAQDAKAKLWLRPQDGISMNVDRLLADAKTKALTMAPTYAPPKPGAFSVPGPAGVNALRMALDAFYFKGGDPNKGGTTPYDVVVGEALGHALTGGKTVRAADAKRHMTGDEKMIEQAFADHKGGEIEVHNAMRLSEDRMLQVERDAFMSLIARKETENRIRHMLAKNKPLREAPNGQSAADIRAAFTIATLDRRSPTGKPVTGMDEKRLNRIVRFTNLAYRLFPQLAR